MLGLDSTLAPLTSAYCPRSVSSSARLPAVHTGDRSGIPGSTPGSVLALVNCLRNKPYVFLLLSPLFCCSSHFSLVFFCFSPFSLFHIFSQLLCFSQINKYKHKNNAMGLNIEIKGERKIAFFA